MSRIELEEIADLTEGLVLGKLYREAPELTRSEVRRIASNLAGYLRGEVRSAVRQKTGKEVG